METKIEALAEKALADLAYEDCFIVDVKVNNTRVEVFLDSDSSVTFEKCRKVSRAIEAVLDEEQWLGEKYTLDVSSAGVGRPLMYLRQYTKNLGRTAEVKTKDLQKVRGVLESSDAEKVVISYEEVIKENNKKKKVTIQKEIPFDNISETRIKISF